MFTLGFHFKPWKSDQVIAAGGAIKGYIEEAAEEHGIKEKIRFQQRVTHAGWSSDRARWVVTAEVGPERTKVIYTCKFIYACTGYYDYASGYTPEFEGRERFAGRIVHPQHWPADLDYKGKRVVVIGSGATAITLVPAMTDQAEHVTMLQRSPTYIVALPGKDPIAQGLQRVLPERTAYAATRWKASATSAGLSSPSPRSSAARASPSAPSTSTSRPKPRACSPYTRP
jgi:cation diffusion facilitator CzcD-associated flavoprotein CzcO